MENTFFLCRFLGFGHFTKKPNVCTLGVTIREVQQMDFKQRHTWLKIASCKSISAKKKSQHLAKINRIRPV